MAETTAHKLHPHRTCEFGSHKTNEIHHHDSWGGLVECLGSERACFWCAGETFSLMRSRSHLRYQK